MEADANNVAGLLKTINDGGVIGLLVICLVGGIKQWWVFGWQYKALERDRDVWREIALRGTEIAHHVVENQLPK